MSGLSDFLFPEAEAAPPGAGPNYNPANVNNAYQPGGLFTQYPFNGGQTAIPPSLGGTDFPLPGSGGAPVDVPSLGTETINPGASPYDPANMAVGGAVPPDPATMAIGATPGVDAIIQQGAAAVGNMVKGTYTWIEELALRALLIFVGVALMAFGVYIAGRRQGSSQPVTLQIGKAAKKLFPVALVVSLLAPLPAFSQSSGGCGGGASVCQVGSLRSTGTGIFGALITASGGVATPSYFEFGTGGSYTWSGSAETNTPLVGAFTMFGTTPGTLGGNATIGLGINTTAALNASADGGAQVVYFGTSSATTTNGALTIAQFNLGIPTTTLNANVEYISTRHYSTAYAPSGGSAGSEQQTIGGAAFVAGASCLPIGSCSTSTATFFRNIVPAEFALFSVAGTAPQNKMNAYALRYTDDVEGARLDDFIYGGFDQYANNNGANAGGALVGIQFGSKQPGLYYPIATTGWWISAFANPSGGDNMVSAGAIDAALMLFTDHLVRYRAQSGAYAFSVDGTGDLDNVGQLTQQAGTSAQWTFTLSSSSAGFLLQNASLASLLSINAGGAGGTLAGTLSLAGLIQTGTGTFNLALSSGSTGFFVKTSAAANLMSMDASGNVNFAGLVQGEFVRFGTSGTTTLINAAGTGINIGMGDGFAGTAMVSMGPATTGSIGGSPLTAGGCASGTAAVTNAQTTYPAWVVPGFISGSFNVSAYVSATGTITVEVCAVIAGTPAAQTYTVGAIQR